MKVVTYKGKKWYHAKTKSYGIFGKLQYFVDIEPVSEKQENGEYYVYPIIDKYKSCIIYDILLLIIYGIGFILSCLGKALILLLVGRVKLIFNKDVYMQTLDGDDIPLLDAINEIKIINDRDWSQWYEVRSKQELTYEELRKAIRANKDWERLAIKVEGK